MLTRRKLKIIAAALIILTLAFIWSNSMETRAESGQKSMRVLEIIAELLEPVGIKIDTANDLPIRKLAHFSEFALLGAELFTMMLLCNISGIQAIINSLFAALSAAVIDEYIQIYSRRGSSVADVLLDFSGAAAAVITAWLIYRHKIKKGI